MDGKSPITVSGALFIPKGTPPQDGWPLLAWAHGTVGIADICAPSWQARSYRDVRYLNEWLSQGFAIVATDYQGLGTPGPHPYLKVRPEAYSVLDSVRAVLKDVPGLANKIVIIGDTSVDVALDCPADHERWFGACFLLPIGWPPRRRPYS